MMPVIEVHNATIASPGSRVLFSGLNMAVSTERVALIGRNGVGKSTLLAVLAREAEVQSGRVLVRGHVHHVPQLLDVRTVRTGFAALDDHAQANVEKEWRRLSHQPFSDVMNAPGIITRWSSWRKALAPGAGTRPCRARRSAMSQ